MATPYISFLSKRSVSEQIQRHYDQTNLIYNVEDIIKAQTAEYNNTLREVSSEQAEIMRAGTAAICGTLEEGFVMVTEELQGIENSIYQLTDTLDTHLKMMINEQRYNNILSENIALLLKVSDSERERQSNILKGLKFFNDALRDPSFFEVSLKFFKKAEEDDDTDYFVNDKIGLIYLSSKDKNYDEAIKYFTKAVKFSKVDTHPSSIRLANILVGDITKPLYQQRETIDYIKYLTGQSLLWISVAYYEQAKFSESIKFAQEAFQIAPTLLDAGFALAKSLAASNQNIKAAQVLEPIIRQNRNYSLKTLSDIDLAPKIEIKNTLEKLRQETFNEASNRLSKCKSSIQSKSKGLDILNKIERLINNKSYLSCKKAIDLLNKKNNYSFNEAIQKNNSGKWESSIKPMTFTYSTEELVNYENTLWDKLSTIRELIAKNSAREKLLSELNSVESDYRSTSSAIAEKEKEKSNSTKIVLGGLGGVIVGVIILSQGMHGFFSALLWLLGLAMLLIGVFMGGGTLFVLIGQSVSSMNLSSKSDKIILEQKNLRNKIQNIEADIQRLENS